MSTTPQTTLQLARQGNPNAIAALMNRHLEAQGITAQVVQQDGILRVSLEADQVPNQRELVAYVKKGITGLELAHIDHLTVSAKQPGTNGHAWSQDLSLQPQPDPLGTALNASSDNGLDLDFDLDGPALEVQGLGDLDAVLDSGLEGTDLDFDFIDGSDQGLASADDFDLSFADSTATDSTDFDLSLTDSDLGFSLDDTAAPAADLDFDLGLTDTPAESAIDLDFDLGFADTPAEATADLDFDLDFGLADTRAEDLSFDLDLGADSTDIDLDLGLDLGAEADATPLNFEPVDLGFDSDTDLAAELDLEPGEAADFDLDLTPEASSTNDTIAADLADLDDLWESGIIDTDSPDLGFTAAAGSSSDGETDVDFPPLDDMAPLGDDLVSAFEATASGDDLADLDFEPIAVDAEEFELEGFEPAGFETQEFDLTDLSPEDLAQEAFGVETLDGDAIATEDTAFPNLDLSPGAGLDNLSPELLPSEEVAFEDLGSADILDLSSSESESGFSDLSPSAPADDGLDSYLSSGTEEFVDDQLDWASTDTPAVNLEPSEDLDLYAFNEEELSTDPLVGPSAGAAPDLAWGLEPAAADDLGSISETTPAWGEGEFAPDLAPDLALDNPENAGFDPGLVFDPMAEANVFANDDFDTPDLGLADGEPDLPGAEPDFPFDSTMELDETVEGDFIVPEEFGDDTVFLADSPFPQVADPVGLGFDGTDEDLAFESVELGEEDLVPAWSAAGLDDAGMGSEGFDDEGFENDGFGSDLLSEGVNDSNGFIQDHDGLPLASDEPDATDDFIHEFGSDPSTHVSLAPDQFDKDGSVKSSGSSGLPMRLILGLGLGALVLALAGLLLSGLLGRRQPTPGDPVVTEPEVSAPDSPTPAPPPVAETDFFREAVNAAQSAANQAQTAGTSAQWQAVADSWARAIDLMQQVPQADPNYAVAQQKAVEYQPNRNYAQQNADRLR